MSDCDIVADVVNDQAFGNWAVCPLKSYSVSFALLALVVDVTIAVYITGLAKDTAT
jgi:hypothetical protein